MMQPDQLKQASVTGNVDVLKSLIRDDSLILERVSLITCCNETPLHIAALCGHVEFVRALLDAKSELASVLDIYGLSPLHLASAKGHVEIVKELVRANSQVCLAWDQDGRTPLRFAWDQDGNTILHLAAILKDVQTTEYLLSRNGIKTNANAVNDQGLTALDISEQYPNEFKSRKIKKLLLEAAGTEKADDTVPISLPPSSSILLPMTTSYEGQSNISHLPSPASSRARKIVLKLWDGYIKYDNRWLEDARGNLMVAATVTATMAFQAGLNRPGGVWQEFGESDEGTARKIIMRPGFSISATRRPYEYSQFVNYNTVSLVASLSTILLMISGFPLKSRFYLWLLILTMCTTVVFILKTYLLSIYLITTSNESYGTTMNATRVSVRIWVGLCGVVIALHTIHLLVWVVKKWRARPYYWMRLENSS